MNESSGHSDEPKTVRKSFKLHVTAIVAVIICMVFARVEYLRALEGHDRSAGYAIQWPIFGVLALWMWRKLYRENKNVLNSGERLKSDGTSSDSDEPVVDEQLNAWRSYLKRLEPPKYPDS
jgi:hypothetical protein